VLRERSLEQKCLQVAPKGLYNDVMQWRRQNLVWGVARI